MKKSFLNVSLTLYLSIIFISAAGICAFMNIKDISYASSQGNVYVNFIFIISGLAAMIACVVGKAGFSGLCYMPRFKNNGRLYIISWLLPAVLTVAGALLYFAVYPGNFDANMSMMKQTLSGQGISDATIANMFRLQLLGGLFISPLLNFITVGMEELGFRGFLYPAIGQVTSPKLAALISTVIWGIWYMPLAAIGYRYGSISGSASWQGMAMVFAFSLFMGGIMCYLRGKTGSIIPGFLFRSIVNGFSTLPVWFMNCQYNSFIGPSAWGILGGLPIIVFGAVCFVLIKNVKLDTPLIPVGK